MNGMMLLYWLTAYLVGAFPDGWVIVRLVSKRDIRYVGSGRTGMSNVTRVSGKKWGYLTAFLDVVKGWLAVWLCGIMTPDEPAWVPAVGGILAVLGHIYSVFLLEKRRDGRFYFRGGAGGMTSAGAGVALWWGYLLSIPFSALLYGLTGITATATGSFNLFAALIFAVAAAKGMISPWYILYCLGAEVLILISLRPNIRRMRRGDERKTNVKFWK